MIAAVLRALDHRCDHSPLSLCAEARMRRAAVEYEAPLSILTFIPLFSLFESAISVIAIHTAHAPVFMIYETTNLTNTNTKF
jgi:hypothetical protein